MCRAMFGQQLPTTGQKPAVIDAPMPSPGRSSVATPAPTATQPGAESMPMAHADADSAQRPQKTFLTGLGIDLR